MVVTLSVSGFFNPVARGQEERLRIDLPRIEHWVGEGAQITERVKHLIRNARKALSAGRAGSLVCLSPA